MPRPPRPPSHNVTVEVAGDLQPEHPQWPQIGQWFWVQGEWFGCVVALGSNYVELSGPASGNQTRRIRVHLDEMAQVLRREADQERVLAQKIEQARAEVMVLMGEVRELTASLGVAPRQQLENTTLAAGKGLATLAAQQDVQSYRRALLLAQKEQLPRLREQLRTANETLSNWMSAQMLALQALTAQSTDVVDEIQERVFDIELYAGLAEQLVQFAEGAPAQASERLRVFQRMLFCDEEALLGYDSGGLEISDLPSFQRWLALPVNRDRVLPYPRCLVAMRVRRSAKERDLGHSLLALMHNLALQEADRSTFLFIRNGEQLYRISTAIEFDELIFPGRDCFDPGEPMMVKLRGTRIEQTITRREFDERQASHRAWCERLDAWEREHPEAQWLRDNPGGNHYMANPHRQRDDGDHGFRPEDWTPFDRSNVYYDEALRGLADHLRSYNRVAVIVQGLFDRSACLAPHPPVQSWTAEGFAAAIELVYDGAGLTHGEPPDFEAYRARCNASIDGSSVLVGQQQAWMTREAQIECRRIDRDPRSSAVTHRPQLFEPPGDPGPGYLARPHAVQLKARQAIFSWLRERRSRNGEPVRATLRVPFAQLFNASAYREGDYKLFFQDPRTRQHYLKWAPLLMAAEDYQRGLRQAKQPAEADSR